MTTVADIKRVLERVCSDYVADTVGFIDGLNARNTMTLEGFDLDSLDLLEMAMSIEDEFDVDLDDYKLQKISNETLLQDLPELLYKAIF